MFPRALNIYQPFQTLHIATLLRQKTNFKNVKKVNKLNFREKRKKGIENSEIEQKVCQNVNEHSACKQWSSASCWRKVS